MHRAAHERAGALAEDLAHLKVRQPQPRHPSDLCAIYCCNSLPIDDKVLLHKRARLREGERGLVAHVHRPASIELDLHENCWQEVLLFWWAKEPPGWTRVAAS